MGMAVKRSEKPPLENRLAAFPLFVDMPSDILRQFCALCHEKSFKAGDILLHQDDEGAEAFVVVEGAIRIERLNEGGGRVLINIQGPGELFGEMALLTGNPRSAEGVAQIDSTVLVLRKPDFQRFLALYPAWNNHLVRIISRRLTHATVKLEEVGLISLKRRLAGALLDFMNRFGAQTGNKGEIRIKLTQSDLAELMFSSREHINKIIKAWEKENLIAMVQGHLSLLNVEKLKDIHEHSAV